MQEAKGQRVLIWGVVIFILAVSLRIVHILAIYKTSPFYDVLPGDLGAYDRWAMMIVEQGWLGKEVFYQDPLYPYFLALLYKVVGRDFFWIYTVQALLGALTALLLVLLGNRVFGRLAGILAGLLYACYAPAIYFDGLLLKVTLSAFLFTLAIYLFLKKDLTDIGPSQYFSGVFLGLACLTRANFLLILPVVLVVLLLNPNTTLQKRLAMVFIFMMGILTSLGPVVARNYHVSGELVLTTAQAGQNFYIGHNPDATGTYSKLPFVRPDPLHEEEDFKKEAEKRSGRELGPAEVSRFWMKQGLEYIWANPLADLKITGKKLLLFLNSYEIPDNHNYYFHQRYSKILQMLPIHFGVVGPFFLLGLLGMLYARRTSTVALFVIQAVYIASVVIFYVFSRYRMPVLPLFCLGAGYGFAVLLSQFRMGQWQKFAASILLLTLGFILVRQQVIKPFDFSHSYTDEGIAYEIKEDEPKALAAYTAALKIDPGYFRALERLGKLQIKGKEYNKARKTYEKILTITPESVEAQYRLMWLDKKGL
jgi:4-amino-4-deoxy-L-arabinose transferase-like glycosyltransferase